MGWDILHTRIEFKLLILIPTFFIIFLLLIVIRTKHCILNKPSQKVEEEE